MSKGLCKLRSNSYFEQECDDNFDMILEQDYKNSRTIFVQPRLCSRNITHLDLVTRFFSANGLETIFDLVQDRVN